MGVPVMRARSGRPELVLERRVAVNGALGDQGDAVHVRSFVLGLAAPVDREAVAGDFVDDVHDEDVVLADLDGGAGELAVSGDYAADGTVCTCAVRIVAVGEVVGAVFARSAEDATGVE